MQFVFFTKLIFFLSVREKKKIRMYYIIQKQTFIVGAHSARFEEDEQEENAPPRLGVH